MHRKPSVPVAFGMAIAALALALAGCAGRSQRPASTHDTSGIIHIESQADIPYTLGQVFIERAAPFAA